MSKFIRLFSLILATCFGLQGTTKAQNSSGNPSSGTITELTIQPSVTDTSIHNSDNPHLIMYDASVQNSKLFLFMPGTHGIPVKGPRQLFNTAVAQGYRVINLSYIDAQAVSIICRGENLVADSECAKKFRTQRIYGTQLTDLIPDKPQDAIVHRLTKLLQYLVETDSAGNWNAYLEDGAPKWSVITVSGQSQGGGMAAFIAKHDKVNRIITFSGGWDFSEGRTIAQWYYDPSITPPERWFATYHTEEPTAAIIDETYHAMGIPEDHIYALDRPVREGKRAHGEAIRNTDYKVLWIEILGKGLLEE